MAGIPISIEKVKVDSSDSFSTNHLITNETVKYLLRIIENGKGWQKTFTCDRDDLVKLRSEIDALIESTTTAEVLKLSTENAQIVDKHYETDKLCVNCNYKLTQTCIECLFVLQSPLERQLFLELSKSYIKFQSQYPLNWHGQNISIKGKTYDDKSNNFKEVLTVVDFYIEKRQAKLCIYTDGHTYHERTEEQAQRDRTIDRKLQELGFRVLRYTSKDVKENIGKIIDNIKKWID